MSRDRAVAAGGRLAEQGLRGTVAQQQQARRLRQLDMLTGDFRAGFAIGLRHARARRVKAGQRGAVGLFRRDLDRGQHPLRELPGLTADRLPRGEIF